MPENDSNITVETTENMPYLRACIKETLRYTDYYTTFNTNFRFDHIFMHNKTLF